MKRKRKLDVIYVWLTIQRFTLSRLVITLLAKLLSVPIILEINERPWCLRDDSNFIERHVSPLHGAAGGVIISQYLLDWVLSEVEEKKLRFSSIAVPILVNTADQPQSSDMEVDKSVLIAASADYMQTLLFVLRAMDIVWRPHPDCRLIITGIKDDDPQLAAIHNEVDKSSFASMVNIVGFVSRDRLLSLYQQSSALLIPMFDDIRSKARFPTKLGEYLASGRPVISSNIGEIPRFLSDPDSIFLAVPDDEYSFGSKIIEALDDRIYANKVGKQGLEVARTRFNYSAYGVALKVFTESIISTGQYRNRQ